MTENDLRLSFKRDTGLNADRCKTETAINLDDFIANRLYEIELVIEDAQDASGPEYDTNPTIRKIIDSVDLADKHLQKLKNTIVDVPIENIDLDEIPYLQWLEEQLIKALK